MARTFIWLGVLLLGASGTQGSAQGASAQTPQATVTGPHHCYYENLRYSVNASACFHNGKGKLVLHICKQVSDGNGSGGWHALWMAGDVPCQSSTFRHTGPMSALPAGDALKLM